ncbi:MAG: hypothetical protein GXO32_02145 [Crenarchaeota archaeon]|nr:hypothetical protein [Thermoproteota archaeon]
MGLREVLEYLVTLQLSGRSNVVEALHAYFVDDGRESVAELARSYGLSKHQLRGLVQRILRKVPGPARASRARLYIQYLAPLVLRFVKPIIEPRDGYALCTLCKRTFTLDSTAITTHIHAMHRDVVEEHVDRIIGILKKCCRRQHLEKNLDELHDLQLAHTHIRAALNRVHSAIAYLSRTELRSEVERVNELLEELLRRIDSILSQFLPVELPSR